MNSTARNRAFGLLLIMVLVVSACSRAGDMIQASTPTTIVDVPGLAETQAIETFLARRATEAVLHTPTPKPPTATVVLSPTPGGESSGIPIETVRPSITPTPLPLSGGTLISLENFETFTGWFAGGNDHYEMGMDGGGYRMIVDMLTLNAPVYSVRDVTYRDIRIEVDVVQFDGPDGSYFGVTCRFADTENYYGFVMDADGYYEINKTVDGEFTVIDSGNKRGLFLVEGKKNHLQVDCYSGTLSLNINDNPLLSVQDSDLWEGKVGLLLGTNLESGANVLFDNFALYQP